MSEAINDIDRFFSFYLDKRREAGRTVVIERSGIRHFTLAQVVDKFVREGYVLHSSAVKTDVLLPQQAISRVEDIANFKGVYASDLAAKSVIHGLLHLCSPRVVGRRLVCGEHTSFKSLIKDRRSKKTYLYFLHSRPFVKLPNGEYLSLSAVMPDFLIEIKHSECVGFLSSSELAELYHRSSQKVIAQQEFEYAAFRTYLRYVKAPSGEYGLTHALLAANIGCYLAHRECPFFVDDVMIGCILLHIGRPERPRSSGHVLTSVEIARILLRRYWPNLMSKEILYAIRHHAGKKASHNKIVSCIWDADRLALIRQSKRLGLSSLSTGTAQHFARNVNAVFASFAQKKDVP